LRKPAVKFRKVKCDKCGRVLAEMAETLRIKEIYCPTCKKITKGE
jgi:phage FluMu protein Com